MKTKKKKFCFAKLSNDGWYFMASSAEDITEALSQQAERICSAWIDIAGNREGHCKTQLGSVMQWLLEIEIQKRECKNLPMVECICFMEKKFQKTYLKILETYGLVLINKNGGCMPPSNDFKIIKKEYTQDFAFPSDNKHDFRIMCWKNGTHWYAKMDEQDIVVDGKQKWCSETETKEAIHSFIKRNNISINLPVKIRTVYPSIKLG